MARNKFYCLDPVENEVRRLKALKANKKRRNKVYYQKTKWKRRKRIKQKKIDEGTYREILRDQVIVTVGIDKCIKLEYD